MKDKVFLKQSLNKTKYWSRRPGKFVDVNTGEEKSDCEFSGTVLDWYTTLTKALKDASQELGDSSFLLCSPDTLIILEHLMQFKPVIKSTNSAQTTKQIELARDDLTVQAHLVGALELGGVDKPIYSFDDITNYTIYAVRDDGSCLPVKILDMGLI